MTPEFVKFPKIGRWSNAKIAITEKIDGTNGVVAISVEVFDPSDPTILFKAPSPIPTAITEGDGPTRDASIVVRAGSRERWLTLGKSGDNYGFAAWVCANAEALLRLGEGMHYGEWWGSGIQRKYGLTDGDKRFSLFNVGRWIETDNGVIYDKGDQTPGKLPIIVPGLHVVPTLYYGPHRSQSGQCMIEETARRLQFSGSVAAPGWDGPDKSGPEGIMVYFETLKTYSKLPFDPAPKGQG